MLSKKSRKSSRFRKFRKCSKSRKSSQSLSKLKNKHWRNLLKKIKTRLTVYYLNKQILVKQGMQHQQESVKLIDRARV